jgi:hypothetical protein
MALANVRTLAARLDRIEQELRGPQVRVALTYSDADPVPEDVDIVIRVLLEPVEPAGEAIDRQPIPTYRPPPAPATTEAFLRARGLG